MLLFSSLADKPKLFCITLQTLVHQAGKKYTPQKLKFVLFFQIFDRTQAKKKKRKENIQARQQRILKAYGAVTHHKNIDEDRS